MYIKGRIVTLKAIAPNELALIFSWINDPETNNLLGTWRFPENIAEELHSLDCFSNSAESKYFAIHTDEAGIVGIASFMDINMGDKNACLWLCIGDKQNRGKKYAIDTVMTMMRFAFNDLSLNRLNARIIEYNFAAFNLFVNKCGWKNEGLQKQYYLRNGKYWDRILIGITAADYKDFIAKNGYWEGH